MTEFSDHQFDRPGDGDEFTTASSRYGGGGGFEPEVGFDIVAPPSRPEGTEREPDITDELWDVDLPEDEGGEDAPQSPRWEIQKIPPIRTEDEQSNTHVSISRWLPPSGAPSGESNGIWRESPERTEDTPVTAGGGAGNEPPRIPPVLGGETGDEEEPEPSDDREVAVSHREPTSADDPLPARERPAPNRSDEIDPVAKEAAGHLVRRSVEDAVERGYAASAESLAVPHKSTEHTPSGPTEKTPGAVAQQVAQDPALVRIDARLRDMPDMTGRGSSERQEQRELTQQAMKGVLTRYGVDLDNVSFWFKGKSAAFPYGDSYVRMTTTTPGVTDVVAWSSHLTAPERERAWEKYDALLEEGTPVVYRHHELQRGSFPPHLQDIADDIAQHRGPIEDAEAAYQAHMQRVRDHVLYTGFRTFQIHTPDLRLALPVALHIIEQPVEAAHDMIGEYSPTGGIIRVSGTGAFHAIRNAGAAWHVAKDGSIQPTRRTR